jgi:hypothetical protein
MRRTLLVVLTAVSLWGSGFAIGTATWAQSAAPVGGPPDQQFTNNAIAALQQQRNRALDEAATAQAQLAIAQNALQSAQKELTALKAASAPKDEPEKK